MGSGSIQGTVTDPTGAVVPHAMVIAVDTQTGTRTTVETTKSGLYALPNLNPAKYRVTVRAQGFQKTIQNNVTVTAFATVGLNLQLKVGRSDQTVVVSALPPQIDTQNGMLETEIPHQVYSSLPIAMSNGPKSPLGFVNLAPGVSSGGNATFDLNGGAGEASGLYTNGMSDAEILIGGDLRPITGNTPIQAVSDFQVITSGVPAYYSGDGVVNIVVKSGSNRFHGTAYENVRNTVFDAAGYFSTSTPVEHQNEYGIDVGGPIIKKRMFFFFNFDGYKLYSGLNPVFYTIPTLAERQGDFSAYPEPIYDPSTTTCAKGKCTRTQFPGNIIPPNLISPISKFLQATLPAPINSSLVDNYLGTENFGNNHNLFVGRLDDSITKSNHMSFLAEAGILTGVGAPYNGGPVLPLPYTNGRYSDSYTSLYQAKDTQTITSNLINTFGYQFNRFQNSLQNPTLAGNWPVKVGLTGMPSGEASEAFPPVNFIGPNSPTSWATNNFSATRAFDNYTNEFQDNVQWVHGNQDYTFGGEMQLQASNDTTPNAITLNGFANLTTSNYQSNGLISRTLGSAYASYLLGDLSNASLYDTTVPVVYGRFSNYALYGQDNWRATSKLNINLGFRWAVIKPFTEAHDNLSYFNPNIPNPAVDNFNGALQFAGNGPFSCHCNTPVVTRHLNFEPRVGFAFNPRHGTVFRGSYSIMNFKSAALGGTTPNYGQLGYSSNANFSPQNVNGGSSFNWQNGYPSYIHPPFFQPTLNTGFNTTTGANAGGVSYADPLHAGYPSYTEFWNLTVQQQVSPSTAFSISYTGSSSHRLALRSGYGKYSNQLNPKYLVLGGLLNLPANTSNIAAANAIVPGITLPYANFEGSIGQMLRPFPQYAGIDDQIAAYGRGHYDALQVVAEHRMSNGFFFHIAYTWNREINDAGGQHARPDDAQPTRNAYDPNLDRTVSSAPTQVFSAALSYVLPIGQGKLLSFHSHAINSLLGNWSLSVITQYQNGGFLGPFGAICDLATAGSCYADYQPGFTGPVRINGAWGKGDTVSDITVPYISVDAFKQQTTPFTYGTTPRHGAYGLRGPGSANESVALDKTFPIGKRTSLRLRADAFNVFNRTVFGKINTTVNNADFGRIGGQVNSPRQLQFEAYLNF